MKDNCYLLFSDIKGFSRLNEEEFELFSEQFIPFTYKNMNSMIEEALAFNTWGDAVLTPPPESIPLRS